MSNLKEAVILITGANRGLGLEMVKQLLKNYQPKRIFATCRSPEKATDLKLIEKENSSVQVLKIDIADVKSFPLYAQEVKNATDGKGLNVLINNGGIFNADNQSLESVTEERMLEFFRVNTLGALLLTQAFLPLLNNDNESGKGLVVNFSSRLGSISDNSTGGLYASRCTRAAMNAITKSMSIDLKAKDVLVFGMNPGWVKTDQGGSSAKLEIHDSVQGILKVLDNADQHQSGKLVQYDGQILDW